MASARIGLNNLPMGENIEFSIKAIAPNTKKNVTTVSANNRESNVRLQNIVFKTP